MQSQEVKLKGMTTMYMFYLKEEGLGISSLSFSVLSFKVGGLQHRINSSIGSNVRTIIKNQCKFLTVFVLNYSRRLKDLYSRKWYRIHKYFLMTIIFLLRYVFVSNLSYVFLYESNQNWFQVSRERISALTEKGKRYTHMNTHIHSFVCTILKLIPAFTCPGTTLFR